MKTGQRLETKRLIIRPWTFSEVDRQAMHTLQSDPVARKFYPIRRTRQQSDDFLKHVIDTGQKAGLGWAAVCLKGNDHPIGFSGLSPVDLKGIDFTPAIETGWQYDPSHWGNGYATEAAVEVLRHGFSDLKLDSIYAFAVRENTASIAVMRRVGMARVVGGSFDHPNVPDTHPQLKLHVLYKLTTDEWQQQEGSPSINVSR